MVDIDAYRHGDKYEKFQYLRHDYVKAISISMELAKKHTKERDQIIVSDFCCGTGSNTKKYAELMNGIKKSILIDINKEFLEVLKLSKIKTDKLKVINKNVLEFNPEKESDIVLAIFAYHHILNEEKEIFIKKIKESLKNNGILIFTEIYLPTKELCVKYYDKLFEEIHKDKVISGLKEFLQQTAESSDFEFKVSKNYANKQLLDNGFTKIEEVKIWPLDNTFEPDIGTFVEVYRY
jgi:ubiquinone/menaquinone biosynthesis C-methylase UbiE